MSLWAREIYGQLEVFTAAANAAVESNAEVVDQIRKLRKVIKAMSVDLSHITTSVDGIKSEVAATVSLLAQLSAKITGLLDASDEDELRANVEELADSLDTQKDALAQAILANTPSDPAAQPAPPADVPPAPEPAPIPEPPLEPVPEPVPPVDTTQPIVDNPPPSDIPVTPPADDTTVPAPVAETSPVRSEEPLFPEDETKPAS